jgi:hypothetical protein
LNRFYEERVALTEYMMSHGKIEMPGDAAMRAIRDLCGVLTPLQEATQLLQGDGGRSPLSVYLPVVQECLKALDPKRPVFVDSGDGDSLSEVSHADLHHLVLQDAIKLCLSQLTALNVSFNVASAMFNVYCLVSAREASAARTALTTQLNDVMDKPVLREKALLVCAAYLDPRFKALSWFKPAEVGVKLEYIYGQFLEWAQKRARETGAVCGAPSAGGYPALHQQAGLEGAGDDAAEEDLPAAKRLKKQHRTLFQAREEGAAGQPGVASCSASGAGAGHLVPVACGPGKTLDKVCRAEWNVYRAIEPINLHDCPLNFWRQRARDLPHLSSYAKLFLGTPSASASVERLFSIFGRVAHGRDNLDPHAAERLIVAHSNYLQTPFS